MKICIVLMAAMVGSATAETLNQWIADRVYRDEQLLVDALAQTGGHSLEMLKKAKTFVPFFLEAPKGVKFASAQQKEVFEAWMKESSQGFLAGGYVYRLKFNAAPPLYAVSSGEWSGNTWHSIANGKDVQIEPGNIWESSNSDRLYTTLLAGARPKLISYNQDGAVTHQETFDASALDLDKRLQAAVSPYASSGKPSLEMISLVEYLKQSNAEWRAVDTTGQFNLRNQHQRADEQERLRQVGQLTRGEAVSGLSTNAGTTSQTTPEPKTPSIVQPPTPKAPSTAPAPSEGLSSSTAWSIIGVLIVAVGGLLWWLGKRRS